jgi:outer membrane murein-binding lipoprotein Lpp
MSVQRNLFAVIITGIFFLSGCTNELKKDTDQIGDAMCRNIEVMTKLRAVNPNDTATINKLQADVKNIQAEMTRLYQDFKKKYGDKVQDKEFNKTFSRELRQTMLDNCKSLSKEDREQFQKDLEK